MENTFLIAGLGNPGEKYINTRHNIGFIAIDNLQKNSDGNFSEWKLSRNFSSYISEGKYLDKKILLIKPQTFMNLSGHGVALTAGFYKIKPSNIIVIHDDKDLPIGTFRIRDMGSNGGHNGIKSISEHLGTMSFPRFKIGIMNTVLNIMDTKDFVLSKFGESESDTIKTIIKEKVVPAIFETLKEGLKSAQNKYNS